jgi:uncharacterized protein
LGGGLLGVRSLRGHQDLLDVEAFLKLVLLRGEPVSPTREIHKCRDPKDDKFLELAVAGRAAVLVSGDADLQSLDPFEGVRILSPAVFLERLFEP